MSRGGRRRERNSLCFSVSFSSNEGEDDPLSRDEPLSTQNKKKRKVKFEKMKENLEDR
ncbi:hypothetical protein Syun_030241 [Stephania yunnanensis]|uniref:Uncharacterized protein n=1 Tax=Stephania yunnanensis TaxID=152371 RepID=A0AAP0EAG2_9MAGN